MPYCPKCGSEVEEDMAFCPKCGASLREKEPSPVSTVKRSEKSEKDEEKREKGEKTEKHEKREARPIGPLIGGGVLIVLGVLFYLQVVGLIQEKAAWSLFLIVLGILIIVGAVAGAIIASRRHPKL